MATWTVGEPTLLPQSVGAQSLLPQSVVAQSAAPLSVGEASLLPLSVVAQEVAPLSVGEPSLALLFDLAPRRAAAQPYPEALPGTLVQRATSCWAPLAPLVRRVLLAPLLVTLANEQRAESSVQTQHPTPSPTTATLP